MSQGPHWGDQLILVCPGLCRFHTGNPVSQEAPQPQTAGVVGPPAQAIVSEDAVQGVGLGASGWSRAPMFPVPGGILAVLGGSQCVWWVEMNLSWSRG